MEYHPRWRADSPGNRSWGKRGLSFERRKTIMISEKIEAAINAESYSSYL